MLKKLTFLLLSFFIVTLYGYAQKDPIEDRIAYAKGVLDEGLKKNDSVLIAEGYYLLAKRMESVNKLEEAYRFFYLSLKINEKLKDHYKRGRIYMRLAESEFKQGNFEGAEEFMNEATHIFEKHNLNDALEKNPFWLGFIRFKKRTDAPDVQADINRLKEREKVAIRQKNNLDLAVVWCQIGKVYRFVEDKRAVAYLEKAVNVVRTDTAFRPTIFYHTALAEAYLFFNQPDKALGILNESQRIIDQGLSQAHAFEAIHYNTYASYYAAIGNWHRAYICKDSASQYLQRLVENDRTGNISRWRVQLETEKKDLELRLQKQEIAVKQSLIEQQQLFMIIVAILLSGLGLISYFLYRNYKKQKRLSDKNAVLIHEQNHRVKNNLQVISSLLNLQNDYIRDDTSRQMLTESQSRIDAMAMLHRQLYENDQVELINIENLFYDIIHSIGQTFGVTSLQLRLPLEVTMLGTDTATSVGLILNELAINSFKYAFKHHEPVIEVSSRKNGNSIQIIYKDFGTTDLTGIFSSSEKKGFGLNLIDMILFQINGTLTYDFKNDSAITLSFVNA